MSSKLNNSRQLRIKGVRSNTVRHGDRSMRPVADRRLSGMAEIAVTEMHREDRERVGGVLSSDNCFSRLATIRSTG